MGNFDSRVRVKPDQLDSLTWSRVLARIQKVPAQNAMNLLNSTEWAIIINMKNKGNVTITLNGMFFTPPTLITMLFQR